MKPDAPTCAYLSGPMSDYPDLNFPAFQSACEVLRAAGWQIRSPHEKGTETPDADYLQLLREDGIMLLSECNAIIMLPGWASSKGACWELNIALMLQFDVCLYDHGRLIAMSKPRVPAGTLSGAPRG